uniref:SP-RING-type domain-containing protein n=1 Tax=Angiostrongylus cantonensis TaxID=6313 RepID=A0A0K0DDY9_ANGCA
MKDPSSPRMVLSNYSVLNYNVSRSRPERGKFTILDGIAVAEPDEILDIDFDADLLQRIFRDSRVGIQFLARYGIIPNTRECKIDSCPKEQLMSLIKHANGFVWRCRSCRKRRERRVITKISVYEGTFLFFSRMPMNKFFIFMLVWCENAGYTASEYNRLLGEFRLVEETIHNTIGFIRDHIQSWCLLQSSAYPIGGKGMIVELLETLHTEDVSAKHRSRRERRFSMRLVLICWNTNEIVTVELPDRQVISFLPETLISAVENNVKQESVIVILKLINYALIYNHYKQFMKTLMESVQPLPTEPFAYEYYFRRTFVEKPFNNLLKAIRELYIQK